MVAFRHYYVSVVALLVLVLLSTGSAYGLVIDSQLSDWGITPFTNWTPNAGTTYGTGNWGETSGQHGSYPCGSDVLSSAFAPAVPEPSVIALLASGLGTGLLGRRVNRRNTGI